MKASTLPWDVASKHSNACMICPAGNTSILKRPAVISSTTLASRRAAPCGTSSADVKAVDIRHCTFGCAMTAGTSVTMAAAAPPPTCAMNRRRSVITAPLPRHELVVGAFGHVVPRPHQRLELRERRVDLPGHGRLLGFVPGDLGGQPLEIAEHRCRELEHFNFPLELHLEPRQRDGVL